MGITFNYGLILGWTSVYSEIDLIPIIFYIGAIFWTLGYDTIYGFQDIKDDEIIGIKSTAIKFKNNPKIFLLFSYSIFFISLIFIGLKMEFNYFYFLFLVLIFINLFVLQVKKLNYLNSEDCLKKFKLNNLLGLLVFINLLIGKIII